MSRDPLRALELWSACARPALPQAISRIELRPGIRAAWAAATDAGTTGAGVTRVGVTGARVMDAGSGSGIAIDSLRALAGLSGHVMAVERELGMIEHARRMVASAVEGPGDAGGADQGLSPVEWLHDDIERVLGRLGPGQLDLIWASDLLWSNYFPDPGDVVRQMSEALAPGGTLAVFTNGWFAASLLPGHPDLQRRVLAASSLRWRVPEDSAAVHHERVPSWMDAAGLSTIAGSVHPVAFAQGAPGWDAGLDYLEQVVWPEYRDAARDYGAEVGLTADHVARLLQLISPDAAGYLPSTAGYFGFQPAVLYTARR